PDNMEVYAGAGERSEGAGATAFYLVRREAVITGRDLKSARAGVDPQSNAPDIEFILHPGAAERFGRETQKNIGRRLAIILDSHVESAPAIQSRITDRGNITGRFSSQEADDLARVLRA